MARCLIIACGCRGRGLARKLVGQGHAVRGTTRSPAGLAAIEAAGAEGLLGDPDVVGTLVRSFEHVSVACVLLGSAVGSAAPPKGDSNFIQNLVFGVGVGMFLPTGFEYKYTR